MKLTMKNLVNLTYCQEKNGGADYRWDDELKGFGVRIYPRIYPSGRKSFFISYRNATNTKVIMQLGSFGELTLFQARELAKDKLAEVRHGNDPHADRQQKRKEMTFRELADRYVEHLKGHKKTLFRDLQRFNDFIFPHIGVRKLSEITATQCQRIHSSMLKTHSPASANRVLSLLRHSLNMAVKWGLINENPCKSIPMYREPPSRDIVLSPEDCLKLIEACSNDHNLFAGALFKFAMFTGRRVGELLAAKWEDLSPDRKVLTLPITKAGERQFVYLNDEARSIVSNLKNITGNQFIFAGEAEGKSIVSYRSAWLRIVKRSGINYIPVHGLRHSYASVLVAAGVPLETVGHLLGHKTSVTTRKYAHHRPDQLRQAAETFSKVIDLSAMREKMRSAS
jgi:integrase